jgi:hypothetical protein
MNKRIRRKLAADAQKAYADNLKQTIEAEMEKATIEEQIVGTTQSRIDQTKESNYSLSIYRI